MKYKTKPKFVDAMQWDGTLNGQRDLENHFPGIPLKTEYYQDTVILHGLFSLGPTIIFKGDYIVLDGNKYERIIEERFLKEYEPASH